MKRLFIISLLLIALPELVLLPACKCGIAKHDRLIDLDTDCDQKWADLESAYQRRMDLLPSMVKIVKARAGSEKSTLEAVMQARANATSVKITAADLNDPEKIKQFEASQQEVSQSFGRLMEIHEQYPDLKSDQGFADLIEQLEGCENRIHVARKEYNAAVAAYNKELKHFDGKVLDEVTGDVLFAPRVFFSAQEGADKAPNLDL